MSWAHPFAIAAVPAVLIAAWWIFRRVGAGDTPLFANIQRRWADRHGLSADAAPTTRRRLRGVFLALGAAAALLALARPQWGEIAEQSYDQSREVMLALDLSRSMLADDVAPSRLARAKLLISDLLDHLKGERVGLIVFSGTAFVQSPLSADYEVLRDFLDELEPSYLPEGGTDYESMLRAATQAFGQQGEGDRYLVVLSDGEALDENWKAFVPALRDSGIRVIGLGVGTPAGALVPDGNGGLVKDEHGAAVLSRLEPATLQELAKETDGTYRDAATWVDIAELVNATVEQGKRGNYVEQRNVRLQDRYQWFLLPALLFFLLSYWFEFPVSPLARALPTRGRRPHPASASVLAAALVGLAAWPSFPSLANAAVSDVSPPQSGTASQPNQLEQTVAALSAQPQLAPTDYAKLATDTIAFASQPSAPKDASRAGVIDDALAGIDRGEAADARAADWPTLRKQLEQLRKLPEPPSQQEQKQNNQEQQSGTAGGSPADQKNSSSDPKDNAEGAKDNAQNEKGNQSDSSSAKNDGQKSDANQQSKESGSNSQHGASAQNEQNQDQAKNENEQKNQGGAKGADQEKGKDSEPSGSTAQNAGTDDSAKERAGRPRSQDNQETKRQDDVKPIEAPEAGLADNDTQEKQDEPKPAAAQASGEPAQRTPPDTRMVGGGKALASAEPQGDTALAEALGQMERVKNGDSPAVLFDRMNRAEGQPRAPKNGTKNW